MNPRFSTEQVSGCLRQAGRGLPVNGPRRGHGLSGGDGWRLPGWAQERAMIDDHGRYEAVANVVAHALAAARGRPIFGEI